MSNLEKLGREVVNREINKLGEPIGVTQEENLIIGWYNTPDGTTKCYMYEIPFYESSNNISKAMENFYA